MLGTEGYYDSYNYNSTLLKTSGATKVKNGRRSGIHKVAEGSPSKNFYWYEFSFIPNLGFLADSDPLMTDCELTLTFGRAKPQVAVIQVAAGDALTTIELAHVHAITEYVSSPAMRNYFQTIEQNPIIYTYDNIEVFTKQLPSNDTTVRFDNMRGGSIPTHIFAGIIPTSAITGDYDLSSTGFEWKEVEEFNISLNGASVNGYPLTMRYPGSVVPLQQFHDVTDRLLNVNAGSALTLLRFESNFVWSHKFEAEQTANGWIGVDFKLKSVLAAPSTLVVWIVSPQSLSIDKFHRIELVND